MTTDAIKAACARCTAADEESRAAHLALDEAWTTYRAEHPAPPGHFWGFRGAEIVAIPLPEDCEHVYEDGTECRDPAVAWNDAGHAWCEEHKGERQ